MRNYLMFNGEVDTPEGKFTTVNFVFASGSRDILKQSTNEHRFEIATNSDGEVMSRQPDDHDEYDKYDATMYAMEKRIETLEAALTEAYKVILHELDSGRTPYLLPVDNGGKGLGYFEDVLSNKL